MNITNATITSVDTFLVNTASARELKARVTLEFVVADQKALDDFHALDLARAETRPVDVDVNDKRAADTLPESTEIGTGEIVAPPTSEPTNQRTSDQ